jgi:hypothetical protein
VQSVEPIGSGAQEEAEAQNGVDLDSVMDDETAFAAMGVAKTIATVGFFLSFMP